MTGPALQLVMKTDTLQVVVLPALGGKVASLRWLPAGLELLQAPLAPYAPRTLTMAFDESDASGFDECLPSVAACDVKTAAGVLRIPDHGDFWRLPWECTQSGNEIRMAATGASLPLRFERTLRLDSEGLNIQYRVQNIGEIPVDYVWSAHPLFVVDPGDRIVLPPSVRQVRTEGSARQRLGSNGAVHPWPRTQSSAGEEIDLSFAGEIGDGIGDKLFAAAPKEGWAALERSRHGVRIEMGFDPQRTPWLGLWLCYGGWPEGKAERQQCVAIEPCTAPGDSLAEAVEKGIARHLTPGEAAVWPMRMRVASVS